VPRATQSTPNSIAKPSATNTRDRDTARARVIWDQATPALGSPVEAYLKGRDLELVEEVGGLRFHPHCPMPDGPTSHAMTAAMTDAVSGSLRGIHRTRLSDKGKFMLGPSKGAVVRLSPDEEVTDGLHICEGIETGLALLAMGLRPLWCCLSAGGIAGLPVLGGVEALTIFADNDASGTGERVASSCAQRWQDAGREVRILMAPDVGTDFADYGRVA
jgi:putative DNA primase/helicase